MNSDMFNQKTEIAPYKAPWPDHVEIRPGFALKSAKRSVSLNNYQKMRQLTQSKIIKSAR